MEEGITLITESLMMCMFITFQIRSG